MKKSEKIIERSKYSDLFLYLSILFVVCFLLSNILAAKLLKIGAYSITAGALVFPISYIINDIFSEVYGYKKTRRIIIFGFIMNLFMVLIFSLAIVLPAPVWFENSEAFELILGSTPRVCLASLIAYLFGSLINSKMLVKMKKNKKNKFGLRAIVSTFFGELTDSLIFVFIVFWNQVELDQILIMILTQVILKTLYEFICLPLTSLIVKKVKKYEGIMGNKNLEKSIVWGTCWFNESVDTLINFLNSSLDSLEKLEFKVVPVVFAAKIEHDENEINYLKNKVNNVIVLKNCTNIFPNKNYGVAIIANKAYELNIDYVAIVDCDWSIKENISFVDKTVLNLINNDYDIVIPNIASASGRSNLLIGRTIINLFYPDYKKVLLTPFPGSLISKTKMLYKIIMDDDYHYDWGGEWDIISLAIKYNMNITSSLVDVKNVRHRPNNSKIQDSFQIWRAALGNDEIIDRFNNLINYNVDVNICNELSKKLLSKKHTVLEMINIIIESNSTKTQKQILYMILYPLAFLTGEIDVVPAIESDSKIPYDKEELNQILDLAMYCAKYSLIDCNIKSVCERCKSIEGEYLSNWTIDSQKKAMKEFKVV